MSKIKKLIESLREAEDVKVIFKKKDFPIGEYGFLYDGGWSNYKLIVTDSEIQYDRYAEGKSEGCRLTLPLDKEITKEEIIGQKGYNWDWVDIDEVFANPTLDYFLRDIEESKKDLIRYYGSSDPGFYEVGPDREYKTFKEALAQADEDSNKED